ncbi:Fur family transcriptional regulator [Candidatus Galacturonibacter soehngenii]|uniref:Transcriptional repressor n=1 Tax=Candidatus Galacturonatibacter soehngenii TaxID=2307010 RepID=A0A7V7QMV9_9FIRM|nr:Fur family transcriptional regulator [Candidatus Galacturonibacter soehngenii]KAB1440112.1 transcriptional repressor [Candidatus Galacturonibacter soehngenii]
MKNKIIETTDLKQTKKRNLIISILEEAPAPLTAEEIMEIASKEIKMSFSTVYRALNALADRNIVSKTIYQDGKLYYKIQTHSHQHVLKCIKCDECISIDACPLESLESNLCSETNYKITGHNLEFFGICPKCQSSNSNHKDSANCFTCHN